MTIEIFGRKIFESKPAKREPETLPAKPDTGTKQPPVTAWGAGGGAARNSRTIWRIYDGEKSAGGIGPVTRYTVDHEALRMRSWQLLLESEIVQIAVSRSITWGVGKGLKLRMAPEKEILEAEGIEVDTQKLSKRAEALWKLFAGNKMASYSNMLNFHNLVWEAEKNAIMGGDCLFIVNIVDGLPKVELKDGSHIRTPVFMTGVSLLDMRNPKTGNRVRHGIEIDAKGEHVAFYVSKSSGINNGIIDYLSYERVPATDEYGNVRAFMYYGIKYRLDDMRGIPLISVCMETTKQLELYKEATVQGAVERAKLVFTVEHELGSIGTNPLDRIMANGFGRPTSGDTDIPVDANGQKIADTFAATTGRMAVNMPVGAKVKNQGVGQEIAFKDFYDPNLAIVFAALEIPYEVALMMFGSNYSASRAAIKDWEHTLEVRRETRIQKAYQAIFELFFLCKILTFKIQAPGYLEAFQNRNLFAMAAYTSAKWIGDRVPNIDELKEVKATRELLGAGSVHAPLITVEDAIERHTTGEFTATTEQYGDELEFIEECGIEQVELNKETIAGFDDSGKEGSVEKTKTKPQKKDSGKEKK